MDSIPCNPFFRMAHRHDLNEPRDLGWIKEMETNLDQEVPFRGYFITLYTVSYEQEQPFTLMQIRAQWKEFLKSKNISLDFAATKVKEVLVTTAKPFSIEADGYWVE